jgi:ABC-type branched-subunit amino acid transport system substrate-binding protein
MALAANIQTCVLILAPTGRDAAAAAEQLAAAGLHVKVCNDVVGLIEQLNEHAGAAVHVELRCDEGHVIEPGTRVRSVPSPAAVAASP